VYASLTCADWVTNGVFNTNFCAKRDAYLIPSKVWFNCAPCAWDGNW
jgi:hypothetical protein